MKSKNIHVLKTNKPSKLLKDLVDKTYQFKKVELYGNMIELPLNIYITSDEEIKEGDYVVQINFEKTNTQVIKCETEFQTKIANSKDGSFSKNKIILTTDQDLIKDGVQEIPYEFLEWFVKNPNCEKVEVKSWVIDKEWDETYKQFNPIYPQKTKYKIIIPKQETLEEVAKKYAELSYYGDEVDAFVRGAKWQQERMYSEEEVLKFSDWIVFEVERYGCPTEENIIKAIKEIKRILRQ